MEKISKISKVVDKVLKVGYWILVVSAVISILMLGVLCFAEPNADIMQGKWSITVGNMGLELADHVMENVQISQMQWMTVMIALISVVLGVFFFCYAIKLLRRILAPMIQEQPFVGTVSVDLRKLGWVIICSSIVMGIVENVGRAIVYVVCDIQNILLSENIVGVKLQFNLIDIKTILLGVLLILLSHIFCYGEKLQRQDDETL